MGVSVVVKEGLFELACELVADSQLAETAAVSLLSTWPKELCWRVVKSRPPVASATLVGTLRKVLQWMGAIIDAKHLDLADSEPFVTGLMGKIDMATGASSVALSAMGKMFSIAAGYRTCAPPAKDGALNKVTLDL